MVGGYPAVCQVATTAGRRPCPSLPDGWPPQPPEGQRTSLNGVTEQTTPTVPTEPTEPTGPTEPSVQTEPTVPPVPPVPPEPTKPSNPGALLAEAGKKSGLLWIDIPGDRAWPAWHAWLDGTAYVVTGPGEQHLPALPADLALTFKSKDTGGRLVTVPAHASVLTPDDESWEAATAALKASRLNSPAGDTVARWAAEATVYALIPSGDALEGPGSYSDGSGAAQPVPTTATTANWHPWHLKGRPKWRRGTRR